jgi:hypothetical protein
MMRTLIVLAAALPLLAACGSDQFSRVSTGAGTGAGTGATIGLLGGPIGVGVGAVIGAGVGAVTGGVTTADQIDLGKPVWRDNDKPAPGYVPPAYRTPTAAASNDPQYQPPPPTQFQQPYVPDRGTGTITSEPLQAPHS